MPLPQVLVTAPVPEEGLAVFDGKVNWRVGPAGGPADNEEYLRLLGEAQGCLVATSALPGEVIRRAPKLKVISRFGIGYDGVDLRAATECGVIVCNAPTSPAEATADLAFTLLLGTARQLPRAHDFTKSGEWSRTGKGLPLAIEVHGRTLGIIGFGRIGRAVARRAAGFSMRVLYYDVLAAPTNIAAERVELATLLQEADFVSLHVPLSEATTGLIGARELAQMKRSAVLINASRGPVVDEQALCEALCGGQIAGAGLDVYSQEPPVVDCPLFELENVVLTPHIGSATYHTRVAMAKEAAENILAVLIDGQPRNVVNPEVLR